MAGSAENTDGDIGFQIAPMIDLILVLMVFFMTTVALRPVENELSINLPSEALGETKANKLIPINLSIDIDSSISFNGDPIAAPTDKELAPLVTKLQEQVQLFSDKTPVFITPQPDVPHRRVIDVLNACSAAKIKNVSFGD